LLLVQRVDLLDSLVHNKITVERDGVKSYTAVTSTLRRKVIKPAHHGDPRLVLLFATGNGQARNVNTNPGQRIRRRRPCHFHAAHRRRVRREGSAARRFPDRH
jgi:hypothetical protein